MIATPYDNGTCKRINITNVYRSQLEQLDVFEVNWCTLISTNCPGKVVLSGVCHNSISDQSIVFAYRKLCLKEMTGGHNTINYWNFGNFNRINFRHYIASQSWNEIAYLTDPNKMWLKWKSSFISIVDKHCPLRTIRVRARSSHGLLQIKRKACMIGVFLKSNPSLNRMIVMTGIDLKNN